MPILTQEQARSEFKAHLDLVANTALFQYTFVIALFYVVAAVEPTDYRLLGFAFGKTAWGLLAIYGTVLSNAYVGRNLNYLAKLAAMHPNQRRQLRFLTRHHRWLFNPYYIVRPRAYAQLHSASAYVFIVAATQIPILELNNIPDPFSGPALTDALFAAAWVGVSCWFWSQINLVHKIAKLGNVLWRNRYSPPN